MKENIIKGAFALILAGIAAYFRALLGPLIILAVVMIIDYITGMASAWVNKVLSSRAGIVGIIKKVSYLFAVIVAAALDYIIHSATAKAGIKIDSFYMFGLVVTIWLILNECLSILENLTEIGVPLPAFLKKAVEKLKKTAERKGEEMTEQAAPDGSGEETDDAE